MRKRLAAHTPRRGLRLAVGARRCSRRLRAGWVCAFVLAIAPLEPLLAQDRDADRREGVIRAPAPPAAAVEHYERGRDEYLAGRYREALQELKAALALDPNSPNLVYNVARVHEDLDELDEAIEYYRRYASLLPPDAHEERDKTAKTIRRLQGAKDEQLQRELEERRAAGNKPEPGAELVPAASDGRADAAFWIIAGTGLALAAGGGVTGFLAVRREKEVSDFVLGKDGNFARREALRKQADELALASDVLSAAAGVAILSAAVLFFSRSTEPSKSEASWTIAPRAGGLGVSATF